MLDKWASVPSPPPHKAIFFPPRQQKVDQNMGGQQLFNQSICLLVAGFVGTWKSKFPSTLTTAGQVTKSIWAGIEPLPTSLSHWAYST